MRGQNGYPAYVLRETEAFVWDAYTYFAVASGK
jgi:hypothetical protein